MMKPHFVNQSASVFIPFLALPLALSSGMVQAKERNPFQIAISAETFAAGALGGEDEMLVGTEFKYFFLSTNPFYPFLVAGYKTDIDKEGSAVDIVYADVGSQWDFAEFWGNRAFLEASIGAAYINEEIAVSLLDREANNSYSDFDFKASLGLGVEWQKAFGTTLVVNQYGSDDLTAGLSFSYSF
ncbi:hypothetical protein [Enterovibrio baiacu]|uniref:hypothetical protein n=1 Tax=Enterovibrio baiacu TaxID=2491023 RepID=UPI00101076EB|nr:hypothetical protein [Enterovibrio baiacu]MBE1275678.1 hypothetical protein [Enterovibrio baiacu]